MKIRVSFLLPALLFAALFAATPLHADTLAPRCNNDTLSDFDSPNFVACSVGILNFTSFTFSGPTGTDSQIELTPCNGVIRDDSGFGDCLADPSSLSGGFSLSAAGSTNPFSVAAGQTVTYTIDWKFVIDTGPADAGADLGLDPVFVGVNGGVDVTQTYCLEPSTLSELPPPCTPHTFSVNNTHPPSTLTNFVTFGNPDPNLVFGDVQTVITLTGGSNGASFDAVTGTATIVDTPEPASFLLVANGLLLVGALRKRAARV
jgi:hypothetical protein